MAAPPLVAPEAGVSRLRVYFEPRDAWIGAYVAPKAVYVCPLPFLVIRWERRATETTPGGTP